MQCLESNSWNDVSEAVRTGTLDRRCPLPYRGDSMLPWMLIVVAFGVGLLLGGVIHARHVEARLETGRVCVEKLDELNLAAGSLAAAVTEVNREKRGLSVGGGPLRPRDERGLQAMSQGTGGGT
jgi:hypothetical protein